MLASRTNRCSTRSAPASSWLTPPCRGVLVLALALVGCTSVALTVPERGIVAQCTVIARGECSVEAAGFKATAKNEGFSPGFMGMIEAALLAYFGVGLM